MFFFPFDRGNLVVKRQPLIPRVLSVTDGALVARKPFKPPSSKGYKDHNELTRRLWTRKRFVPWGSSRPALVPLNNLLNISSATENDSSETSQNLPPGIEPLVLWQPDGSNESGDYNHIEVDPLLVRYLRPHQRYFGFFDGNFIFQCLCKRIRSSGKYLIKHAYSISDCY